jgi:hypothetical protein
MGGKIQYGGKRIYSPPQVQFRVFEEQRFLLFKKPANSTRPGHGITKAVEHRDVKKPIYRRRNSSQQSSRLNTGAQTSFPSSEPELQPLYAPLSLQFAGKYNVGATVKN